MTCISIPSCEYKILLRREGSSSKIDVSIPEAKIGFKIETVQKKSDRIARRLAQRSMKVPASMILRWGAEDAKSIWSAQQKAK